MPIGVCGDSDNFLTDIVCSADLLCGSECCRSFRLSSQRYQACIKVSDDLAPVAGFLGLFIVRLLLGVRLLGQVRLPSESP